MNDVMLSQLAGAVCPMHYYGDPSLYDYENNSFGFVKGDLSLIRERNRSPLGMGPYTFVSFEDGTVLYEKNTSYYKGEPKVGEITLVDVQAGSSLDSIADGTVDAAVIDYDDQTAEKIIGINVGAAYLNGHKYELDKINNRYVNIRERKGFAHFPIVSDISVSLVYRYGPSIKNRHRYDQAKQVARIEAQAQRRKAAEAKRDEAAAKRAARQEAKAARKAAREAAKNN